MSEKQIEDGGPAFPGCAIQDDKIITKISGGGMSLRDHFAGLALHHYLCFPSNEDQRKRAAREAYSMADEMLAARKGVTR